MINYLFLKLNIISINKHNNILQHLKTLINMSDLFNYLYKINNISLNNLNNYIGDPINTLCNKQYGTIIHDVQHNSINDINVYKYHDNYIIMEIKYCMDEDIQWVKVFDINKPYIKIELDYGHVKIYYADNKNKSCAIFLNLNDDDDSDDSYQPITFSYMHNFHLKVEIIIDSIAKTTKIKKYNVYYQT